MKWISVKDKKPPFKRLQLYLVSNGKEYSIAYYMMDYSEDKNPHFFSSVDLKILENISHWIEIIEPEDFDSNWLEKQLDLKIKVEEEKIPLCNCNKRSCVTLWKEDEKTVYKCWDCYMKWIKSG